MGVKVFHKILIRRLYCSRCGYRLMQMHENVYRCLLCLWSGIMSVGDVYRTYDLVIHPPVAAEEEEEVEEMVQRQQEDMGNGSETDTLSDMDD